jgi:hypothetical protein
MRTIKLNKLVFQVVGLFISYLIIVGQFSEQSVRDLNVRVNRDLYTLHKGIMAVRKKIGMLLKANQTNSQN